MTEILSTCAEEDLLLQLQKILSQKKGKNHRMYLDHVNQLLLSGEYPQKETTLAYITINRFWIGALQFHDQVQFRFAPEALKVIFSHTYPDPNRLCQQSEKKMTCLIYPGTNADYDTIMALYRDMLNRCKEEGIPATNEEFARAIFRSNNRRN